MQAQLAQSVQSHMYGRKPSIVINILLTYSSVTHRWPICFELEFKQNLCPKIKRFLMFCLKSIAQWTAQSSTQVHFSKISGQALVT